MTRTNRKTIVIVNRFDKIDDIVLVIKGLTNPHDHHMTNTFF